MLGFSDHVLDETHRIFSGRLPDALLPSPEAFETLWDSHPDDFHDIKIHGRVLKTPRWQQAFGTDYRYTGNINRARPIPSDLEPIHAWAKDTIDARLNGLLLNWYDAQYRHYIGKHRDSPNNLVEGAPIVTISLGRSRTFRMRPWRGKGFKDFEASHGIVFVMPWQTNRTWTHEVPHFASSQGRRISVTIRAFQS